VEDAAAAGRHLERVRITLLALLQEELGADQLHVAGTAEQAGEAHGDQRDDEAAAPVRRLRREQRAGGVVDAACAGRGEELHRVPPAADAAGSTTYIVTAGVTVRICSFSRAVRSTRRLVACAWRSAS